MIMEVFMIIQHSLTLLEQLSELEEKIRKIETVMDGMGIEVDRESLLKILASQKAREE